MQAEKNQLRDMLLLWVLKENKFKELNFAKFTTELIKLYDINFKFGTEYK